MKKQFLIPLLMTLLMMAMSPQKVWAQQTEVSTYDELTTAINAGATSIKVTANLEELSSPISVTGKTVEIDFDGHTVTGASSLYDDKRAYLLEISNSNVTIKNLTATCHDFGRTQNNSSMTLSNCTITASETSFVDWNNNSQLNINNCVVSGSDTSSIIRGFKLITLSGACEIKNEISSVSVMNYAVKQVKIQGGYKLQSGVNVTQQPKNWGSYLKLIKNTSACATGAHTMQTNGTPATCTTTGSAYYHCTKCNVDYADEQGDWLYAYGHSIPILGHDIDAETGKCSRCDAEYQMLKEGVNTNLTFEAVANNVSSPSSPVYSDFTTVYCFKAPATGQLTIKCGEDDYHDLIGLFDAQFDLIGSGDTNVGFYTSITKPVVEGNVYYIGMRASYPNTQLTGRSLIISGTWPKDVTITDGEAYTNLEQNARTLTYKRTVSEDEVGKWEALYVPFQMSYNDWNSDFDVATIQNFHEYTDATGAVVNTELEARYVTSGYKLKANTPYLIRPKSAGEKTITITNTTVATPVSASIVCQSVERKYTFTGVYEPKQGLQSSGCYIMTDGSLLKATDDQTTLKAQRWYLTIDDLAAQIVNAPTTSNVTNNAKAINISIIDDGDATGIESLKVITTPACSTSASGIYDLQGRRQQSLRRGINIVRKADGRVQKVMVK